MHKRQDPQHSGAITLQLSERSVCSKPQQSKQNEKGEECAAVEGTRKNQPKQTKEEVIGSLLGKAFRIMRVEMKKILKAK